MSQYKSKSSASTKRLRPTRATTIKVAVFLVAILVPVLSMIPSWYGYRVAHPPEKVFMGFRYLANDHYQYASFISQAADEGRLLSENRFTTEPQKGRFLLLYMWLTGRICRVTGLGIPAAWELMRFVSGFTFMLAAWSFIAVLFDDSGKRMLAYLVVAFGGGIGWALFLITGEPGPGITPSYLRDAFNYQWNWSTFGSMLMPIWVAAATIFLVCARLLVPEKTRLGSIRPFVVFLLAPLIWFIHPYTGMAAYFAFGLFPFVSIGRALWHLKPIDWNRFWGDFIMVLPVLISFAVVATYLLWARQDLVFAVSGREVFFWNPTYSIFLYPFAYGLLLPLALCGLKWSSSLPARARDIMIAWLISSVILSVNPFLSGVKFQYLVHLPLALFAAHGAIELRRLGQYAFASIGVGTIALAALLFLNMPLILVKDFPSTAADPHIYLSTAEIDAMKFLKGQAPGNVLSSERAGNLIPWLAGKKVYLGHWFLTIDHVKKTREVAAFFEPSTSTNQKRAWLAQQQIHYVYYGRHERAMGAIDPALQLNIIYENDSVMICTNP